MDKLNESFDLANADFDLELLERVNPVFNTAKTTLSQLASTGDEDAISVLAKLGLNVPEAGEAAEPGTIVMETRFRTMGALAEQSGCATVVDLPCGYTPRALTFARKSRPYVGLDLPAAILEAEPAVTSLLADDERPFVRYFGVDATNYASLRQVFDQIEGDVCITTEGLLMYFTDSETGQLCDSIHRILAEHGGCWLLADAETTVQYILTARAFYGDRFTEVMMKQKAKFSKQSDVEVNSHTLVINPRGDIAQGMREAMAFLAAHGLAAERLPVADHAPALASLAGLPADTAAQIRESMKQFAYWKITALPAVALDVSEAEADTMGLSASLDGDVLTLKVVGRVDTLTAPKLLSFFEKAAAEHDITEARIDCSKLDYISSAGLRVLSKMRKACTRGISLSTVNEKVREILDQTGFGAILRIEE